MHDEKEKANAMAKKVRNHHIHMKNVWIKNITFWRPNQEIRQKGLEIQIMKSLLNFQIVNNEFR